MPVPDQETLPMRPLPKIDPTDPAERPSLLDDTPALSPAGPGTNPIASPALILQDRVAASLRAPVAGEACETAPIPLGVRAAIIAGLAAAAWAPLLGLAHHLTR